MSECVHAPSSSCSENISAKWLVTGEKNPPTDQMSDLEPDRFQGLMAAKQTPKPIPKVAECPQDVGQEPRDGLLTWRLAQLLMQLRAPSARKTAHSARLSP
jgi:hypothetical protein